MKTLPTAPNAGEKIRITFFRDLVEYVRSITPIAGPNVKLSKGPNGTTFSCEPGARSASGYLPRPFEIRNVTKSGTTATVQFEHPYIQQGNLFMDLDDAGITMSISLTVGEGDQEDAASSESQSSGEGEETPETSIFLALKLPGTFMTSTPEICKYDKDTFIETSKDLGNSLIPLYKVSTTARDIGTVLCDLRCIPTSVQFEG